MEIFSYLEDTDEYDEWDAKSVMEKFNKEYSWTLSEIPRKKSSNSIKPLKQLNLAEWIDLDKRIVEGDITGVITMLLRECKTNEWGHIIYEPYSFNLNERREQTIGRKVPYVIGIWEDAVEYRNEVMEAYRNAFDTLEEDLTEEEREGLTPTEIRDIEKDIQNDNRRKHFSWQKLLDEICGGDWSRIPNVLELNHLTVFNMIMMRRVYD